MQRGVVSRIAVRSDELGCAVMARLVCDVAWGVAAGGAALLMCIAATLPVRADTLNGALLMVR